MLLVFLTHYTYLLLDSTYMCENNYSEGYSNNI